MRKLISISLIAGAALLVHSGCMVPINEGSRNAQKAEGILNPDSPLDHKTRVPPLNRVIGDFEDGTRNMNPQLYGASLGYWKTQALQGNRVNSQFVVEGGASGNRAAHIFGVLQDLGNAQYPTLALVGRFKRTRTYDASMFQGVKFYYKCAATDRSKKRRFEVAIASTAPVSEGGVCMEQCGNNYGTNMATVTDWTQESFDFADLTREEGWGAPLEAPDLTDHLKEFLYLQWYHGANNAAGTFPIDFWVDDVEFY